MFKYFDHDFFKFLLGFITVISISLMMVLITKAYDSEETEPSTEEVLIQNT